MGAFDDLIPRQATAQRGNAFADLIPQQPAAPDPGREASLGERFMVNADEGFEGTLAGQAVENWMNEGNRYGAQAGTVQDILRVMADQGLEQAPQTLPNPAQGGTPSPEGPGYLGAGVETAMPGLGTGDMAGMSVPELQERLAMLEQQQAEGQAEYDEQRAPVLARREGMPGWHEQDGLGGKGAAGIAALLGQLAGGAPSPENLVAFGRGASVLGRAGRGAAGGAAGAGVAEPVVQEQEVRRGERDDTSMAEGAFNVALGGLLGGALNVTPDMARGVRRLIAGRKGKPEADVTPEDLADFDPDELMATAQAASDAATLDPEALESAIRTGTGQDARPRVGEGMAPKDAKRARRDVERELGQAFESTDVTRRDDVELGEDGPTLREDAQPLRDPTGEQANPDSYGARSVAARTAQELGVTLDENGIRLAARDIQADPQADPAAVVRSYSQEGNRSAFELAERRRGRREDDLATGENVDRQASTYRAAEEPYERQGQREVTLLGARRNQAGQLVGGEAVEVLARAQRQTPNGQVQNMARIVRGDEDPVWVPASQLETVTTPENPRMFGEALSQTQEPPRGVARERGDSPEGFDASQTPQPRRAVDRQADPDGLRRGLYQEGEPEPTPGGPTPRAEETFDGNTGRPYREAETTDMSPQGEARTESQGEGGTTPVTRTRRPVQERSSYSARMREPDPEGELNLDTAGRMSDEDMEAMFESGEAQLTAQPRQGEAQPATRSGAQPRDGEAQPDAPAPEPDAQAVNANAPEGLADPETARALRDSKDQYGWAERGGNLLRDAEGRPKGRTRWLPANQALMDALKNKKVTEDGYQKLVDRALDPDAKPLTDRQRGILEQVLEAIDPRSMQRAEAEAEADMEAQFGRPDGEPEAQPRDESAQPDTPWYEDKYTAKPTEVVARRSQNPDFADVVVLDLQGLRDSSDRARQEAVMTERLAARGITSRKSHPHSGLIPADRLDEALEALDLPAVGDAVGDLKPRDQMGEVVPRDQLADDYELSPEAGRQLDEYFARQRADAQQGEARRQAQEKAEIDAEVDDFDLAPQTEASRAEGERATREREDTARRQRLNQESRAQADRDADDFTLTGSDRPADEAAARGQLDMTDQAAQPRDTKSQDDTARPSGGGQLYSGIPLDRIAAAVKKAWGGEARHARETAERTGMLMESTKEALGGSRAKNRATKRSPLTDLWRVTLASLDGDLRTLAGKFNSPTLKSLPDMFHATAGRGDGVRQTFDEAVQARNNPRLQEVDRFMSRLRDAKLSSAEKQQQVIRLIENPKAARNGEAGKVAKEIEAFLKKELEYLRKAGVEVGEVRDGYFPREMDGGKARANSEGFIRAATRAYKEMGLRDKDAKAAAEAYWESTVYGASGKPGARRNAGQSPSFVQSRVFTKAAAKHLDAYRVRDIDSVLSQYVMRATKRAEIARRFGDNWKDWPEMEAKIRAEDPGAQEILPLVRDRVALSAGVNLHGLGAAAQHSLSMARTWTTLATLPKAAMSSVGELVIAPWRGTTGSIPGDLGQNLVNLWAHLGNFSRTLTGLSRSEQLQASFEMAEDIGIIAGTGHNSLMAARFAGGDPVGRVQSEVLAQFFRRNLLEGLTNYTRVTSMVQGQVFLRRLGKQMERHPARTGVFLRELGVPKGEEAAFARFVRDMGDDLPTGATVTGPYAGAYRNALQRFTDQTVMRPSASTRPKYASHPLGAVIFQLQAFGYAFQKNVLNRQARLLASKDLSAADKLGYSAAALPAVALLVGLQGLMRDTRDRLYDPDIRERKTPLAHFEGAVSQAGLLGVADPYLQSLTGIRYQRNPLASLMGPAASGLAETSMVLASGALNNSDNTNTAERNLADSVYDWLLEPAMQAALTPLSTAAPITGKLATAATIYGIPKGRDYFTDALAGPRSDRKKPPIQGTLEWIMNGPVKAPSGGRGGGRAGGRSSGRDGGRDGGR